MDKMLRIFTIVLLVCTVSWSQGRYDEQLKQFDRVQKTLSQADMLKYHHSLKNIYIQSIINNDLRLKIRTLQRLMITSSSLGLDSKAYEKELRTLQKMAGKKGSKIKVLKLRKPLPSTKDQSAQENKISELFPQKRKIKKLKDIKEYKNPHKTKYSNARILKVQNSSKGLSLVFDRSIGDVDVKGFALKGKLNGRAFYRYVYDMGGVLVGKAKKYKVPNITMQVSQYNKKVVRVVFSSYKKLKLYYSKIDNTINIGSKYLRAQPEEPEVEIPSISESRTKDIIPPYNSSYSPSSKSIVIDAGHGGKDGGAQGSRGLSEKKVVLQVALRLGKELKARGFRVYFTRTRDKFIKLRSRTRMANKKGADMFVSIHANAAPYKRKYNDMQGVETFFLSPARSNRSKNVAALENKSDIDEMDYFSKQTFLNFLNKHKIIASNKLALDIQQGMINSIGKRRVKDGGVREAPFWVLVGAQMPAVLVEIGYITHPIEGKRLASKKYQTLLANGIANGIQTYFANNK